MYLLILFNIILVLASYYLIYKMIKEAAARGQLVASTPTKMNFLGACLMLGIFVGYNSILPLWLQIPIGLSYLGFYPYYCRLVVIKDSWWSKYLKTAPTKNASKNAVSRDSDVSSSARQNLESQETTQDQ